MTGSVPSGGNEQGEKMNAFLTGSQKYGTTNEESDIDVVVRTDDAELIGILGKNADAVGSINRGTQQVSVKFGKLNMLLCLTDAAYDAWAEGTQELLDRKPVTRIQAITVFCRLRQEKGVNCTTDA